MKRRERESRKTRSPKNDLPPASEKSIAVWSQGIQAGAETSDVSTHDDGTRVASSGFTAGLLDAYLSAVRIVHCGGTPLDVLRRARERVGHTYEGNIDWVRAMLGVATVPLCWRCGNEPGPNLECVCGGRVADPSRPPTGSSSQ